MMTAQKPQKLLLVTTLIAIPCLSGLQVRYNMRELSGNRVVEIKVLCAACQIPVYEPLGVSAVYKVILSSYIARGGSGSVPSAKKNCPIKVETLQH